MKLSVIICTCNRSPAIRGCLESVVHAIEKAGQKECEIIIVDNASTDDTSSVLAEWAKTSPFPVKTMFEQKQGLSAARNCGLRNAQGDLLIFIDDDCRMSPQYISEFLSYDKTDADPVLRSGSVVLGNPEDLPITIKSVTTTRRWKRPLDVAGEGTLLSCLIGCNMAARRDVFTRLGYFDELLGAGTSCPAAEDTDYFYRAYLNNILMEMVPNMIVAHHHGRKEQSDMISLSKNYEIGNGALAFKYLFIYPNFSRHFVWSLKGYLSSLWTKRPSSHQLSDGERLWCSYKGVFRYAKAWIQNKVWSRRFV